MSLRADFMAQKRLDEEEKEIKTTNQLKTESEAIKIQQNPLATGGLNPAQARLNSKYFKLKQTLEEIKEIVEQGVKIHDDIIVSKQILQKINECEVDK